MLPNHQMLHVDDLLQFNVKQPLTNTQTPQKTHVPMPLSPGHDSFQACTLFEHPVIPDVGLSEPACHLSSESAAPVLAAAPVALAADLTAEMHGLAVAAAGGWQASWLCAAPWKYATPSMLPACAAGTLF